MKNRVLRSALAVILVIAMVLTMAACNSETEDVVTTTTPAATVAPVATETPVAPTEAPVVTTAPTVAPTTSATQDTVADDFGITLTAVDGTYGTDAKNVDGDKIKDEDEYNKVIDKPYGYYLLSIDEDLINDQDYDITITYGNVNIYSNVDGKQWIGGTTTYTSNTDVLAAEGAEATFAFSDYDGDSTAATGYIYFVDEDEIYILFKEAGEYELELEVVIEDKYQDYGAWDNDDRDEFETTLTSVLTIAKQSVAISFDPIVVKVDEDSELIVDDATTAKVDSPTTGIAAHYFENGEVVVLDGNGTSTFGTSYGTFAPSKTILPNGYSYEYSIDYTEETAVGTYAVSVAISDGSDEVDIEDVNEELANHIITSVSDTEIYVVSAYDWNEIRDVVTSISEIKADETGIVALLAFEDSNYTEQLPLAVARYNALSSEQQAWFETGSVVSFYGTDVDYTTAVEYWIKTESSDYDPADAAGYLAFMEEAQDAYDLSIILEAFDDYAEDAGIDDYTIFDADADDDATGYYTSNSSAISAFNLVDAYWNALSEDDQDEISESGSKWYDYYDNAKDAFDAAEVTAVQELIVGAYNAYVKAVDNGAKVIYQYGNSSDSNFTAWAYINSSEVISLTAQAQAAYDALTSDQKDILKSTTDGVVTSDHIAANTSDKIAFANASGTVITYKEVLDQLTDMNEMIETMITVANYVNIEDYSTDGVVYYRLLSLVYGEYYANGIASKTEDKTSADSVNGMYFPVYDEDPTGTIYRFAMQDIIDAPTRNYDAIIAEYQAWIDFVLYLEDYKADLVDAFKDGVADAIAELDTDDYDASDLSSASSMSNAFAKAVIAAIEDETEKSVSKTVTAFGSSAVSIDVTSGLIVKADFVKDYDSIEEIMEELEDFCDIEDVIDSYIDSIKE